MKILRERLLTVSRAFGRFPSLGYALIYLALIPTFATIYYFLPLHFYHATIQYERPIEFDADKLRGELDRVIRDRFNNAHGVKEPSFRDRKVRLNPSRSLTVDREKVSLVLDVSLISYGAHSVNSQSYNPVASFSWRRDFITDSDDRGTLHIKQVSVEGLPDHFKWLSADPTSTLSDAVEISRMLFPYDYEKGPPNAILMPLSEDMNSKIIEFAKSAQAIPLNPSGNYVRMFYLSAATITTLGYGDIVPLTTTSRLLVSVEAILGIVIIGLFLNALAYESNS